MIKVQIKMKSIILFVVIVLMGGLFGVIVVNAAADYNSSRSNTSTSIHENVLDTVETSISKRKARTGLNPSSLATQIHADVSDIVGDFPFPVKGRLVPPCEDATSGC